jgi:hypothetical protein
LFLDYLDARFVSLGHSHDLTFLAAYVILTLTDEVGQRLMPLRLHHCYSAATSFIMTPSTSVSRIGQLFTRLAFWSAVIGCGATFVRAELLLEHERGGLDRYIGIGGPVGAGFSTSEAIRIEAVTGWLAGSDLITVSIAINSPQYVIHSQDFAGSFISGLPGKWQGVSGVTWDLQSGDYFVTFDNGSFPIAYGGPASAPTPLQFNSMVYYDSTDNEWHDLGFPIGLRVYGNSLSAVPEPATYGSMAGLALVGMILLRRRSARLKTTPAVAS